MTDDTQPMQAVTETIEPPEPEEAPEPAKPETPYRTLLELWRAVLKPARGETLREEAITPQWATKIVATYQQVTYADTPAVSATMYELVDGLGEILDEVIASDSESFAPTSVDEDREQNSDLYKDLLAKWQGYMLTRELEWAPTDANAAVQLAAMSEVHTMFFGQNGLAGHLDQINFEFTEADQAELQQKLETLRDTIIRGVDA